MRQRRKFSDLWLLAAILVLLAVGLLANFSTSIADGSGFYQKQFFWIGIGSALALTILSLPLRFLEILAYIFYGLSLHARSRLDDWCRHTKAQQLVYLSVRYRFSLPSLPKSPRCLRWRDCSRNTRRTSTNSGLCVRRLRSDDCAHGPYRAADLGRR